jgi:hypothetical protein
VSEAMKEAGVQVSEPTEEEPELFHLHQHEIETSGRFTFAFVREPLSWFASMYRYRRQQGTRDFHGPGEQVDEWVHTLEFPEFLHRMATEMPDFLSHYFELYVGPRDNSIDFVGRYEALRDDLVLALREAGQSFDEPMLRTIDPINVANGTTHLSDPDLITKVMLSERRTYDRFYPGLIPFWLERSSSEPVDWASIVREYESSVWITEVWPKIRHQKS